MADPSLIFPAAEFENRTRRLQAEMAKAGIDALLVSTQADIFYLTGFLTRFWESPARPWYVVVPSTGAPIAVIPAIGALLMGQTWLSQIETWDAPDPEDDGVSLLADVLGGVVPTGGTWAFPMGLETHMRTPFGDLERVIKAMDRRRLIDGTAAIQRTREIKSPAEISKIREVCAIAGRSFERLGEIAHEGKPLDAVFRDFQRLLLEDGADWVSYVAGAAGPRGYGDVISPATKIPLAKGDVLMLDTGAVKDGYFCDFDRNVAIGAPSVSVQKTHDALWEATDAAKAEIRPGLRACDVHRLLSSALKARGATPCPGRLGHGLGVTLTEWPSFTPKDTTQLRAGMVLTLEPSAFVEGSDFLVHEENIVLTETGAEWLSPRAARSLPVLGS